MDLTQERCVDLLIDIILREQTDIALIHLAPPCGTASAARAIALPRFHVKGFRSPVPLRSVEFPQGLPDLQGRDRSRVDAANTVGRIVDTALQCGIRVSVENPVNSLAWLCEGLSHLLYRADASEVRGHL
eukprot:s10694_g1.t1